MGLFCLPMPQAFMGKVPLNIETWVYRDILHFSHFALKHGVWIILAK